MGEPTGWRAEPRRLLDGALASVFRLLPDVTLALGNS